MTQTLGQNFLAATQSFGDLKVERVDEITDVTLVLSGHG
jgi:hypothetical protein